MTEESDPMSIDAEKLRKMIAVHVRFLLFDLRSLEAFEKGHIAGASHVPKATFLTELRSLIPTIDTPVVIYDEGGIGVLDAIVVAEKLGYINIVYLEGGFEHWKGDAPLR